MIIDTTKRLQVFPTSFFLADHLIRKANKNSVAFKI
jgi:hypothetical protein